MPSRSPKKLPDFPPPVGPYEAVRRAGGLCFFSGQIPLDPKTGDIVRGGRKTRIRRAFRNLLAVAAKERVQPRDFVKLNIYLTDIAAFAEVNEVMEALFPKPFPARALVGVAALPKGADVEVEAVASAQ